MRRNSNREVLPSPAVAAVIKKYFSGLGNNINASISAGEISGDLTLENVLMYAADVGSSAAVFELIQSVENPSLDNKIKIAIHAYDNAAFKAAAKNGHLDLLDLLVELTPNGAVRDEMIHGHVNHGDPAFTTAAMRGNFNIINRLIELTPDDIQRQAMIGKVINPSKNFTIFMALISDQPIQNSDDRKTAKLKELRQELIGRFEGGDEDKKKAANVVVATLLSGNNLRIVGKYFTDLSLTRIGTKLSEQSSSSSTSLPPPPPPVTLDKDLTNNISQYVRRPIDFPALSNEDKEVALTALAFFFDKPAAKIRKARAEKTSSSEQSNHR